MFSKPFSFFDEGFEKARNIKNKDVFNLDYVPPEIFLREQAREIGKNIGLHLAKEAGDHLLVSGPRGTGKTLTVKYLLAEAQRYADSKNIDFSYYYIPVRECRTTCSILRRITGLPYGTPPEKLFERAKGIINSRKTVIVLDEVEFFRDTEKKAKNENGERSDILYFLTRGTRSMIITITASPLWRQKLEDSVQSSFQPQVVFFPPYSTVELFEILRLRAEMGLMRWDKDGLYTLAGYISANYNGDARYGILALKHLHETNKWDEESIKKAVIKSVQDLEYLIISSLVDEKLYLLFLITQHPDGITTSKLYNEFVKKYDLSKPTFFLYLGELELLSLIYAGGGVKGKPYLVTSTLRHPELVKEEAVKKMLIPP